MTMGVEEKPMGDVKSETVAGNGVLDEKVPVTDGEVEASHVELPEAEAKRILSKVDYRLVPMLALLYLVAFIDRSNSKYISSIRNLP
jgi:hypothetical protein